MCREWRGGTFSYFKEQSWSSNITPTEVFMAVKEVFMAVIVVFKPWTSILVYARRIPMSYIMIRPAIQPETTNNNTNKRATSGDNNSQNLGMGIAGIVLFCCVLLILLGLAVRKFIIHQNKQCRCVKYRSKDDSTGECIVMIEQEQLLKDFFERNTCQEDVQEVCNFLLKRRFRTTDCERVAHKWKFKKADIMVLRNETDAPNGCPGKILIETLILSIKPSTTVREFADSLKNINHDAYDVLMKHCTVPAYVENTT